MTKNSTDSQAKDNTSYAPVVIVGGGVVGATTALLLAKNLPEINIFLIDAGTPKAINQQVHDKRVFALSPASIQLLTHAGVWQHMQRRADYTGMQVWATNGAGELTFGSASQATKQPNAHHTHGMSGGDILSSDVLGSMLEPSVINAALADQLAAQENITMLYGTKVAALENISNSHAANSHTQAVKPNWKLTLVSSHANTKGNVQEATNQKATDQAATKRAATKQHIYTPLVIGADGRGSFVREAANIGLDSLDYQKTAICCAIKTQKPHRGIARQVFLPTGPLALLPLADLPNTHTVPDLVMPEHLLQPESQHNCWQSVVWTLPTQTAQDILAQPSMLAEKLARASEYVLGDVLTVADTAAFPLTAQQAQNYVQTGLALVGDAAHGVHPLAGQGLNLGLLDVAVLTDVLLTNWQRAKHMHWADLSTLQIYEQKRRGHNTAMMHAFSLLGWVFAQQNYAGGHVLEWLRSEAVLTTSKFALLEKWFSHQASGMPQLAGTRW